jgi:rhodanese-related sulfurtransferase
MNMTKAQFLSGFCAASLMLMPAALSSRAAQNSSQKDSQQAASKKSTDSNAKDALPFPQVPRITAEETQRLIKEKGNVVLVDTDDSEAYADEHIKSAINITYDPTTDAREADQSLSVLPGDKLIVFYCNCAHEEDSAPFVQEMWQLGYDHDKVKALQGGLTRWEQLHYPLAGTSLSSTPGQKGN